MVISHISSSDTTADVTGSTSAISACTDNLNHRVTDLLVYRNIVCMIHEYAPKLLIYTTKGSFVQSLKIPSTINPRCICLLDGRVSDIIFVVGDFIRSLIWLSLTRKKRKYSLRVIRRVPVSDAFVSMCVNNNKRQVIANDIVNKRLHIYSFDGFLLSKVNVDKNVFPHRVTTALTEGYIVSDPVRRQLIWLRADGKVYRRVSLVADDNDWEGYSTSSDITVDGEDLAVVTEDKSTTVSSSGSSTGSGSNSDSDEEDEERYFIPGHIITDTYGRVVLGNLSSENKNILLLSQNGEYMATLLKHCSHAVVEAEGQTLCVIRDWTDKQQLVILDYKELCTGVFPCFGNDRQ